MIKNPRDVSGFGKSFLKKRQNEMNGKIFFMSFNLGRNILELYNVLVHIRLTTSKTKRDIEHRKLGLEVT